MRVVILPKADDVSRRAADLIVDCVRKKPTRRVGPSHRRHAAWELYGELIRAYEASRVSFSARDDFQFGRIRWFRPRTFAVLSQLHA